MTSDLAKKLLVKPGNRVLLLHAPDEARYRELLAPLPEGATVTAATGEDGSAGFDVVLLFAHSAAELAERVGAAVTAVDPGKGSGGILWIAYPKQRGKAKSDLSRDVGWESVDRAGWEGVSIISIDEVWSGVRCKPKAGGERKLRDKPQRPEGHEISVSKTVAVPVTELFDIWSDEARRRRWLPEPITVRKATRPKSMRITWADGRTNVDANFYPKGEGKSYVSAQHGKLPDADAVARMKTFWSAALERMKASLEAVEDAEK